MPLCISNKALDHLIVVMKDSGLPSDTEEYMLAALKELRRARKELAKTNYKLTCYKELVAAMASLEK